MPLVFGYSDESISKNIKKLIEEGYSKDQAVAIALDVARRAKAAKKRKRTRKAKRDGSVRRSR